MGIFSKPKPPKAADVSQQQQQYNNQAAQTQFGMQGQAANRDGVFGSTTTQLDANGQPIGQTSSLDPSLNSGGLASNFGEIVGQLPGTTVDFSNTTPQAILETGMQNYDDLAQDPMRQGQGRINQELANRGIPLNDGIATDMQGNFDRQNALARGNAFSTLYGQLPGMQAQMTNTAIQQGNQPYQQAQLGLGLLGGAQGLAPQFANLQPQGVQAADYAGNAYKQFQGEQDNFQNMWSNIGNAAGAVGGMAMGKPMGLGGLFNGSKGGGTGGKAGF